MGEVLNGCPWCSFKGPVQEAAATTCSQLPSQSQWHFHLIAGEVSSTRLTVFRKRLMRACGWYSFVTPSQSITIEILPPVRVVGCVVALSKRRLDSYTIVKQRKRKTHCVYIGGGVRCTRRKKIRGGGGVLTVTPSDPEAIPTIPLSLLPFETILAEMMR